jgi:hypothetical protein
MPWSATSSTGKTRRQQGGKHAMPWFATSYAGAVTEVIYAVSIRRQVRDLLAAGSGAGGFLAALLFARIMELLLAAVLDRRRRGMDVLLTDGEGFPSSEPQQDRRGRTHRSAGTSVAQQWRSYDARI